MELSQKEFIGLADNILLIDGEGGGGMEATRAVQQARDYYSEGDIKGCIDNLLLAMWYNGRAVGTHRERIRMEL